MVRAREVKVIVWPRLAIAEREISGRSRAESARMNVVRVRGPRERMPVPSTGIVEPLG